MSRLSNPAWDALLNKHIQSRAIERRGLRHIHDCASLDELAENLVTHLFLTGVKASVRVESVWIDGTPQAKALTSVGPIQCELADLLVILNVIDKGTIQRRSAVLIQAKVDTEPTNLPSGSSTFKERALLEKFDDTQPLELYRDTKAQSQIGSYPLKLGKMSFKNHARYMVMPSMLQHPIVQAFGPFIMGWPLTLRKKKLGSLELFRDIPILLWDGNVGSPLISSTSDAWTCMIEDLLGRYKSKRMKRFGGFNRVEGSLEHASFMTFTHTSGWPIFDDSDSPNTRLPIGSQFNEDAPPEISILSIVVELKSEDAG